MQETIGTPVLLFDQVGCLQGIYILVLPFCRILVLVMRFTLPVLDDVVPEYVLHFVTDLNLCSITNQLGHGASSSDVVLKDMDKLLICFHWISITHHELSTNKELCCSS